MLGNNYFHANANGTYNVRSNACQLANVNINTAGATGNTLTLYDTNTGTATGNVIAVINTVTTTPVPTLQYNVQCLQGLTAVMATGTAADITISTA